MHYLPGAHTGGGLGLGGLGGGGCMLVKCDGARQMLHRHNEEIHSHQHSTAGPFTPCHLLSQSLVQTDQTASEHVQKDLTA